jgi:hypothetical protein
MMMSPGSRLQLCARDGREQYNWGCTRMIRKNVQRFSEKIMRQKKRETWQH